MYTTTIDSKTKNMKKRLWYGTIKTERKFTMKSGWIEYTNLYLFHRRGLKFRILAKPVEIIDTSVAEYICLSKIKKESEAKRMVDLSLKVFFDSIPPLSNEAFDRFQQDIYPTRF